MLDVKAWVRGKLEADAALLALLGSADQICFEYPNTFSILPIVTYMEMNQSTAEYVEDAPITVETYFAIDVWTDDNGTTAVAMAIDSVMIGLLFDLEYSGDTPEPDTRFRHRVMRYRRQLTAEDLT
jgi:hypothetical protein